MDLGARAVSRDASDADDPFDGVDPDTLFDVDPDDLRRAPNVKWRRYPADVVPAWLAEMDVLPCPAVRDAVLQVVDAGTVGYQADDAPGLLFEAFSDRYATRHGWRPDPAGARAVTGTLAAFARIVERLTDPGDRVVVQTPVYPPFVAVASALGRTVVGHRAVLDGGRWTLDPERFAAALGERAALVVLVNPINPTGTVMTADELATVAQLVDDRDLVVVSDEVHADLAVTGRPHVPTGSVPGLSERTITLASAAKSHNLAGYRCAVAHFGSPALAAAFDGAASPLTWEVDNLGIAATVAAWREGDGWLRAVLAGLRQRRDDVTSFLDEHLPEVVHVPGDATALAWLDCSGLHLPGPAADVFRERALVALADGAAFGAGGDADLGAFVRMTYGTSGGILSEILERMVTAVDLLRS